ncbi:putative acetyltransferase [Lentzea sp. NBRC 105346]|uniref:GNAT family N-acetyltransferase n=1 Tax=Lentzea sp. NBRC 105346 TaxID=3032205 RepID=UPI0024A12731|nr:GNAT family N-acetyltransferase [Lentzea sp. NBRC 105346]GLZ33574.1 putative acetyltransferase [Lentzea sp. NBRC 105346]
MEAIIHTDVGEFAELTRPRYEQDPVLHTVAIGVLHRLLTLPQPDDKPIMVTLHEGAQLIGSVLRTPPWPAQLADVPLAAIDLVVSTFKQINPDLPGVIAPSAQADAFAAKWTDNARVTLHERLYRLGELDPPTVQGTARLADESDVPLLAQWRDDFFAEALPTEPKPVSAEEQVRRMLALGSGVTLWEVDGKPVAWATAGKPNAGMSRIGPVYTPREHRRHGYGAAVSAAASQWALDQGAEHVVLFADLLNPVSNSIYQRIGYREVCDWTLYEW